MLRCATAPTIPQMASSFPDYFEALESGRARRHGARSSTRAVFIVQAFFFVGRT
jgi:hypothetical protein